MFSPPTRGWSDAEVVVIGVRQVLPAYAGVVRCAEQRQPMPAGFSPPTRGWSRVPEKQVLDDVGSPRLRGGGPKRATSLTVIWWFSPPTRGWSHVGHVLAGVVVVLPAYAGVVRRTCRCQAPARSSPRLRGGGPEEIEKAAMLRKVLPAYAGVVRRTSSGTTSPSRSPRLRGGGPVTRELLNGAFVFSPPTRGSEDVAAEDFFWVLAPRLRGVMPKKPRRTYERA